MSTLPSIILLRHIFYQISSIRNSGPGVPLNVAGGVSRYYFSASTFFRREEQFFATLSKLYLSLENFNFTHTTINQRFFWNIHIFFVIPYRKFVVFFSNFFLKIRWMLLEIIEGNLLVRFYIVWLFYPISFFKEKFPPENRGRDGKKTTLPAPLPPVNAPVCGAW